MNKYQVNTKNLEIEIIADKLDFDDNSLRFYRKNEMISVFKYWESWQFKDEIIEMEKGKGIRF